MLGMLEGEPARAREAAGLLVGGRGEQDVALEARNRVCRGIPTRGPRVLRQPEHDFELHRHEVLHVDGATAIDVAVRDVGRERIVGPPIRRGRDDVEVREEQERRPARPVTPEPGDHGTPARHGLEHLRRNAEVAERIAQVVRYGELCAGRIGRIDRWDPDEVPKRLDEPFLGARLAQPPRRLAMMPRTKPARTITTIIATRIRR